MEGNLKNCENPRIGCHTVFGKLVDGFDTLNAIANMEVPNPQNGKPTTPVTIEKVNIIRKGRAARNFDAADAFKEGMNAKKRKMPRRLKNRPQECKKPPARLRSNVKKPNNWTVVYPFTYLKREMEQNLKSARLFL